MPHTTELRFVLGYDVGAGIVQDPCTFPAVVAHSGEYHGERGRAEELGDRPEHDVDRGAAGVLGRRIAELGDGLRSSASQDEVPIAGGYVDRSRHKGHAIGGLDDGDTVCSDRGARRTSW